MNFTRSFALRLTTGLGALALSAALTGCGIGTQNTTSSNLEGTFQISGKVHGGEQPVVGSNIQVFSAGTTGYGTGAASIMNTAVTTDSNGFFLLTGKYTCPSSTSLVYITATGGNPGAGVNSAIKLASAIGTCSQLQSASYVWINEVTTAATAFALAQYYGAASGGFGAPNTTQAQLGLTNAIATVGNLVDSTTGLAVTSGTKVNATLGNITTTPDATKLYTIANIIAACVNSDGSSTSPCQTTLYPDVTPTGGTAPTDTLAAAVLMNTNPTSNNANGSAANLTAIYGLQTATSPFVGLSSQPADWTIGISYTAGTSTTQTLINGANDIAIDSGGNIWIVNYNSGATATESLAEFSPVGAPLANPFNSGATAPASMAATTPRNLAIDTNNNIYIPTSSSSGYLFAWNPTSSAGTSYALGSQPYGVAVDGANNVYVSHNSGTTYTLAEFPSAGSNVSPVIGATNRVEYPFSFLSQYMTVNSAGVPYLSNASTQTSIMTVTGMNPGTCTTYPCTTSNDSSLTATYTSAVTGMSTPFGLAPAASGAVWGTNSGGTSVVYINGGTSTVYGTSSSFAAPRKVAVDGNNVAWVLNRSNGGVSQIKTDGTILSPVPVSPATSPVGYVHTGTGAVTGIATDPSGNVWISNGAVGSATGGNSIFEIVGVAAPTVTPIALAIKNGSVGVKP